MLHTACRIFVGIASVTLEAIAIYSGAPPLIASGLQMFAASFGIYAILGFEQMVLIDRPLQ